MSRLSLKYPNVTGAFHDDMLGLLRREGVTAERYGEVYAAVKSANPALKLWGDDCRYYKCQKPTSTMPRVGL